MDFKFSKDSGDSQQGEASGEKKKQGPLLVLLLILIGGFTYLYFFTALIKPQEGQKTTETPVPVPQIVKMPLPTREDKSAEPNGKIPEKTETPKSAASPPVTVVAPAAKPAVIPPTPAPAPAAKPAPAPAAKPAPAPAVKPVPVPAKPKEELKKPETAKPADKKPQQVPVADNTVEKTAATKVEAKKTTVADKKSSPAKDIVKKPGSDGLAKSAHVVKTKKAATGSWTLMVGNYVLEEALSADMGRVRKAGFVPVVKPSVRKKMAMNRLFVSEFNDRASAQSTLEKLKRLTSDAFIIEQGGRFAVYAGSYLQSETARSEKGRLNTAGFPITVKHSDIAIPTQSLSVGPFNSKKRADAALARLKSAGIKTTLSQK